MCPNNRKLSFIALFFAISVVTNAAPPSGKGGGKGGKDTGGDSTVTYTPITMEYERYKFRNINPVQDCMGEDDYIEWRAVGSLKPGESFSFTPDYPACAYHPAVISTMLKWEGSTLSLSSVVPYRDFASSDTEQRGKEITAPVFNNTAQLCMFPLYQESGIKYTITITNTGNEDAHNIVLDGHNENDRPINYYHRCLNADADQDGWNDSFEHTLANLTRYIGYIDDVFQMNYIWGPNYLKAVSETSLANDEVDANPADFNDDAKIDSEDMNLLTLHLGEGNGLPLQNISPNPGDPEYFYAQVHVWRRYDLNADGLVDLDDVDILDALMGQSMPMTSDLLAPTAKILSPLNGTATTRGTYVYIEAHAFDNSSITSVEFLVNSKVVNTIIPSDRMNLLANPKIYTWWEAPNKRGKYQIAVRVTDGSGKVKTSDPVTIDVQ